MPQTTTYPVSPVENQFQSRPAYFSASAGVGIANLGMLLSGVAAAFSALQYSTSMGQEPVTEAQVREGAAQTCFNQHAETAAAPAIIDGRVAIQTAPQAAWENCIETTVQNYPSVEAQQARADHMADFAGTFGLCAAFVCAISAAAYSAGTHKRNALYDIGTRYAGNYYFRGTVQAIPTQAPENRIGSTKIRAVLEDRTSDRKETVSEKRLLNLLSSIGEHGKFYGGAFQKHWDESHLDDYVRNRIEAINALRLAKVDLVCHATPETLAEYNEADLYPHLQERPSVGKDGKLYLTIEGGNPHDDIYLSKYDHQIGANRYIVEFHDLPKKTKTPRPLIRVPAKGSITRKTDIAALLRDTVRLPAPLNEGPTVTPG